MDKEDFYELLNRFVKHIKEYNEDAYEWVIEDMENNDLFEIYGDNLREKFEEMI